MSIIASPIGAPVEAPIAAVLQTFFEAGPTYGYVETSLALMGVGTGINDSDGSAITTAALSAVGTTA